ncbi:NlpC/P60 family protein [Haloferula sp. BvORR071]|uniref:NlpC/P60 family protein n=1 Tax=Haloferula sp. BvORR071 TaxID=1396141 RepID=UPI00054DDEE9|nr:NlpC/P60 family protein [Haloferula sp. BvORR071]
MKRIAALLSLLVVAVGLSSCGGQVKARQAVSYRFQDGKTAMLKNGVAYAPKKAPTAVKRAIAAGNRLQNKPYKWGGGHAKELDSGYDCSGTVSYVLREAGLMQGSMPSNGYFNYGKKGEGDWITVYCRSGHVFMTVAGLRLDTGGPGGRSGPRWKPETRSGIGHVMRHPSGL